MASDLAFLASASDLGSDPQTPVCNLTSLVLTAALLCGCCSDTYCLCQYILALGSMHCERRMRGSPRCWCACKALVQQQQPAQRASLSLYAHHHRTVLSLPMALLIAASQQRNCLSLAIYAAEGIFLDMQCTLLYTIRHARVQDVPSSCRGHKTLACMYVSTNWW